MKLKDWLKKNRHSFQDSDLRFLIKGVFGKDLSEVMTANTHIDSENLQYLDEVKQLSEAGMPLSYILGKEIFYGLEFKVDKDVLIPRPETELSVEKALGIINEHNLSSVLDLGCGCGNIAISIARTVDKDLDIVASDVSKPALTVAGGNAEFHNVDIEFIHSDLFENLQNRSFDLIVSNPPYVEDSYIKGSLLHEPRVSLSGGEDGFFYVDKILRQAKDYLTDKGWLIVEMGYKHKDLAQRLLDKIDFYKKIDWIKDYSGHFRAVILRNG